MTCFRDFRGPIQYAIQDEDDELLYFIKNYNIQKEQNYESSRSELNNENQTIITSEGNWVNVQDIQNPIYHQPKGRIPFKRLKSAVEKHSKTSTKTIRRIN